jgi:hypothetical protein
MKRKAICLILAALLGVGAAAAQERPMSKPQSPTTQGDPTAPPNQTGTPSSANPIAPERPAPDGTIRETAKPDANPAAPVTKDTSTEAPGGQAESSRNGALSTSPPAEPRPPLAPEPHAQPEGKGDGPP